MTRSTNFEFMRAKCAELADEAAEIEGLVHRAEPQAINLLCAFGEKLLQLFVLENGGSVNRADSSADGETIEFGQLLRQCENKSQRWHVPEPQRVMLKRLLSEGNKAKHRLKARHRSTALSLVQDAWAAAGWVWKQLQWGNAAAQFVEPPKGGAELDDARKQKVEAFNLIGEINRQKSEAERRADEADRRAAEAERSCDVSGWICKDERNLSAPANFVGREFVFGTIKKFLANSESRVLLIQGQPGRGKTAIIQKFVSEGIPAGMVPFVFCFKDQSSQGEPKRWVRHLYASLVERWQLTPPNRSIQEADLEELVQQLRNRIAEVAEKHCDERLLFVIDGVDEAGPAEKKVVSFLQSKFPETVQVIATTRPNHVSLSSSSADGQPEIQILNLDDREKWNKKHQADVRSYVEETMPSLPVDAIKKVGQLSDGNFLILLLICRELRGVSDVTIAKRLREINLLKQGESDFANELFKRSWQRLERLDAKELGKIQKLATLLASARAPLSGRIIKETLKLELESGEWVKLRQHFGEYLEESLRLPPFTTAEIESTGSQASDKESEPLPVFRLFHQTFADFVRQHLKDDLSESNSQLVDYCREQLKQTKPSYEYAYALLFLPAHLMRAAEHDPRRWNELEELLTDIFFLEAKAQAGFVDQLTADFSSAWQALPPGRPNVAIFKLLEEAIRRESWFITEHVKEYPQALFQCAWNLAWWYGNPDAAPYYEQGDRDEKKGTAVFPGKREVGDAMRQLLETWQRRKQSVEPSFYWLRSRRPPAVSLVGRLFAIIPANRGGGWWVDCTADGKLLAGGDGSSIRIWNADTLKEVARMPEWDGKLPGLQAAAISPDGSLVIAAYAVGAVWESTGEEVKNQKRRPLLAEWNTKTDTVRTIAHRHKNQITGIAFSPDGSQFATASSEEPVRTWDAKSFKEIGVFDFHVKGLQSLCWSSDGQQILIGNAICISGDGTRIAFGTGLSCVSIQNAATGDLIVTTAAPCDGVCGISFSPDGTRVVYAGGYRPGPIVVSDAKTGATICELQGYGGDEMRVCYLLDGKRIASGSSDGTICIWEVDSDAIAAVLKGQPFDLEYEVEHVSFLERGKKLLIRSEGSHYIWDGQSGIPLTQVICVGWRRMYSANGWCCASFCRSVDEHHARLQVWDTRTSKVLFNREWKHRESCIFNLSQDGKTLGFTDSMRGKTHIVRVFDVASGRELAKLKGHEDEINHLCFSANGTQIATASNDHTVRVWDASTGELLTRLHHEAAVRQVWFSPDGTQIVTFGDEDGVRVFDSDGGIEYFALDQNKQSIKDLCFSPDGTRIVAEASGSIFIWDAKTGELLQVIAGSGDIRAIAADVEGKSLRLLVRGGKTIVETASGQIVARHPGWLSHIATHPDGRTWAGASSNYLALIHLEGGSGVPS